jgi:hypothetical protein
MHACVLSVHGSVAFQFRVTIRADALRKLARLWPNRR